MNRTLFALAFVSALALALAAAPSCYLDGELGEDVTDDDTQDEGANCIDNPLIRSCFDSWLRGCYEPDITGECSDNGHTLVWSDGHRIQRTGNAGFYSPGATQPCVAFEFDDDTLTTVYENDGETILDQNDGRRHKMTCPDGSQFTYTEAEGVAFNYCRGIICE